MLRGATLDQRIATGFNRNHRGNSEGGIIDEEYLVEYVVDRVDTTATVWLGLTVGCARCHDHKFDPVTQKEYYQLFSFFNNLDEKGRVFKLGNSPPLVVAPTRQQQRKLQELTGGLAAAEAAFAALEDELVACQSQWADSFRPDGPTSWAPRSGLVAHLPLDGTAVDAVAGESRELHGAVTFATGMTDQAASFDGAAHVDAGQVGNFNYLTKFTFAAWISPTAETGTVLARMANAFDATGYSLMLEDGKLQINLINRWLDDALRVETRQPPQARSLAARGCDLRRHARRFGRAAVCRWPGAAEQGPAGCVEPIV